MPRGQVLRLSKKSFKYSKLLVFNLEYDCDNTLIKKKIMGGNRNKIGGRKELNRFTNGACISSNRAHASKIDWTLLASKIPDT